MVFDWFQHRLSSRLVFLPSTEQNRKNASRDEEDSTTCFRRVSTCSCHWSRNACLLFIRASFLSSANSIAKKDDCQNSVSKDNTRCCARIILTFSFCSLLILSSIHIHSFLNFRLFRIDSFLFSRTIGESEWSGVGSSLTVLVRIQRSSLASLVRILSIDFHRLDPLNWYGWISISVSLSSYSNTADDSYRTVSVTARNA